MLAKEAKQQKGKGRKRSTPSEDGRGGKRKAGEERPKPQEGSGKMRLDALSVGYFRRVGDRLSEGFEDDEERGEH